MIADLSDIPVCGIPGSLTEARSRSILESLMDRIGSEPARIHTDPEGRITAINPAFSQLCGHTFEDLKGRKPGAVLQGPKSSRESVQALRDAIRRCVPCVTELVNYHKNRSTYRVRIDLRPEFSESGGHLGFTAEERKLD